MPLNGFAVAALSALTATALLQPAPSVAQAEGEGPFPLVVYCHGDGWMIVDIDTYDASARALALGANAVVMSSRHRQGPEARFPAAHQDSDAAYIRAVENADVKPLGKPDMAWFVEHALASMDKADPRIDLADRTDLQRLPAATVITAPVDPLRSDGQAYAAARPPQSVADGWPLSAQGGAGKTRSRHTIAPARLARAGP